MKTRIYFKHWGQGHYKAPSYVWMHHDDEPGMAACIAEGIARLNGLQVIALVLKGHRRSPTLGSRQPIYQVSLARITGEGQQGMTIEAEVGFSYDPDQGTPVWRKFRADHDQRMLALMGLDDPPAAELH